VKVLMIIAPRGFQDQEYSETKRALEEAGIDVVTCSTQPQCEGKFGTRVQAQPLPNTVDNYDALVLIGGPGVPLIRKENKVIELVREAWDKGKVVAAICWSPTILGKAGVVKGRKCTVWLGFDEEYNKNTDEVMRAFGCEVVDEDVVRDGRLITANGPHAARAFGNTIVKALHDV